LFYFAFAGGGFPKMLASGALPLYFIGSNLVDRLMRDGKRTLIRVEKRDIFPA